MTSPYIEREADRIKAFNQGVSDCQDGKSIFSCPYWLGLAGEDNELTKAWRKGWLQEEEKRTPPECHPSCDIPNCPYTH